LYSPSPLPAPDGFCQQADIRCNFQRIEASVIFISNALFTLKCAHRGDHSGAKSFWLRTGLGSAAFLGDAGG